MNRETEFLSVALVRYADSCPATLHPDCPFAEEAGGQRSCERQCRDEIVRLSKPGHSGVSVFSGPLFDARQYLLSEATTVPDANWHTSSLIQRLRMALLHPPRDRNSHELLVREIDVTNSLAYLGHRGFDPDWLVRFGLAHALPVRLTLWVTENYVRRATYEGGLNPAASWLTLFEEHVEGAAGEAGNTGQLLAAAQRNGFVKRVESWLQQAPLDCVVSWAPIGSLDDEQTMDDGKARWMVDRFAETYLSKWADTSLHHEHRYLRGAQEPPVPLPEMRRRQVTDVTVDREIARRAVEGTPSRLGEVTSQALSLLGEGRRREAAALFDAARILDPQDAEAHHNYGFCLTPDDPGEALKALVRAEELGSSSWALNRLNQAVALRLLDRPGDAIEAAERAYAETGPGSGVAWLWEGLNTPDGPTIAEADLAKYVCAFALEMATEIADGEQVERWRARLEKLPGALGAD